MFVAVALHAAAEAAAPSRLVLARDGVAQLPVFANKRNLDAAKGLARYLKEISGADFAVQETDGAPEGPGILVGPPGTEAAAALPGDSFIYRADPAAGRLHLFGATERAHRIAVYAFLEEQLGCRWWSWNEEDVPKSPTIEIGPLEVTVRAPFRQTDQMNNEAYHKGNDFQYKCRGVSSEVQTNAHAMYEHVAEFGKKHPEIYPFSKKEGKRAPNKLHLCYTNPDLAGAVAAGIERDIRKRGGNLKNIIYMSGMGDWYGGMCECETCEKVYAEEVWTRPDGKQQQAPSSTMIQLMNRVAEILEAKYPGIQVGTMPYMSVEGPPAKTVPRHNMSVRVPHLRHCIIHPVDSCRKNNTNKMNLERWAELAPNRLYIWDYSVNFGDNFLYPFPIIRSLAGNIKYYAKIGVAGMTLQGNYVSTGGDLVVLKNYVWNKLMWNPALDTDKLIREFCDGYYGPAAKPLTDYVLFLEDLAQNEKEHLDEFAKLSALRKVFYTPENTNIMRQHIEAARAAAAGREPYARRVEEAAVGIEMIVLDQDRPLVEHEGRLCQVFQSGPVYTYDRAVAMLGHSRQASFKEWNDYKRYHEPFLVSHGGPLAVLEGGDLKVQVAPAMGLRIRQIFFRGKPLLSVPKDFKDKEYRTRGGAYEKAYPGWIHGKILGQPEAGQLQMTTEHDGSAGKLEALKKITVEGDTVRISSTVTPRNRKEDLKAQSCHGVVEYAVGKHPQGLGVFFQNAAGEWVPAVFPEQEKPTYVKKQGEQQKRGGAPAVIDIPAGTQALRVVLPMHGCTVEERYQTETAGGGRLVGVKGGSISLDNYEGILMTSIQTTAMGIKNKTATEWLDRRLRIVADSAK